MHDQGHTPLGQVLAKRPDDPSTHPFSRGAVERRAACGVGSAKNPPIASSGTDRSRVITLGSTFNASNAADNNPT